MSVLRSDRCGESSRETFIFLASLSHRSAGDKILKLLISSQTQHFLTTTGGIPGPEIFVHDVNELFELERCTPGKLGYQVVCD